MLGVYGLWVATMCKGQPWETLQCVFQPDGLAVSSFGWVSDFEAVNSGKISCQTNPQGVARHSSLFVGEDKKNL